MSPGCDQTIYISPGHSGRACNVATRPDSLHIFAGRRLRTMQEELSRTGSKCPPDRLLPAEQGRKRQPGNPQLWQQRAGIHRSLPRELLCQGHRRTLFRCSNQTGTLKDSNCCLLICKPSCVLTTSYMLQKPRGNAWRDQELEKCEWIATDGIVGNEDWHFHGLATEKLPICNTRQAQHQAQRCNG